MTARDDFLAEQGALYDKYLAPPVPPPVVNPPLWLGDFSTGDYSQWRGASGGGGLQAKAGWNIPNRNFEVIPSPIPGWSKAGRFTVYPGDNNVSGSGTWERCEMLLPQPESGGVEGLESWYAFTMIYSPDTPHSAGGIQFHPTGAGGPGQTGFRTWAQGPSTYFDVYAEPPSPNSQPTHWLSQLAFTPVVPAAPYEVLLHFGWSVDKAKGLAACYYNAKTVQAPVNVPTLFAIDKGVYLKFGIYRAPQSYPETVTLIGMRRCGTYADAIAGFKLNTWPATVPA